MTPRKRSCPRCKTNFYCQSTPNDKACWCHAYPAILAPNLGNNCVCESCLKEDMVQKIQVLLTSRNLEEIDFTQYRTQETIEDIDYQLEEGWIVFTKWFHLKRGYCCKNDCRNCPYSK